MLVRVSYDCPRFMRGHKMYDSGRLNESVLVALLQLDHHTRELSVYFLEVHLTQSTFSMQGLGHDDTRAAVQLAFLPTSKHDDVLQLCHHAMGTCPQRELFLVEFPKVLFAGFYHCLKRLQELSESDFAFQRYIAPAMDFEETEVAMQQHLSSGMATQFECPPPEYARAQGFAYNLSSVVAPNSPLTAATLDDLSSTTALELLRKDTTLDEGQAMAFKDSLTREFALTQGPPGCGKTFLGAQLVKVLLDSRPRERPILLVCQTNHALDNFLVDLRDAGVPKLLRVGSGSKEEWTDSINLLEQRQKTRLRKHETQLKANLANEKKVANQELELLCNGIHLIVPAIPRVIDQLTTYLAAVSSQTHTGIVSWPYVQATVYRHYPEFYNQITLSARGPLAQTFAFEYWAGGGDLENIRSLHVQLASRLSQLSTDKATPPQEDVDRILLDLSYHAKFQSAQAESSIWNLPLSERQRLVRGWEMEVDKESFAQELTKRYFKLRDKTDAIKDILNERDIRIMKSHNVIGMTTTACAARWEILRALEVEVLICEEAAEVMEPHTLCSLLPTIKHAIFIGDPQQLRPETNERLLSLETQEGATYRLNESLLERLMMPRDLSSSAMPTSHLNVQRRMHPDIASLCRITYPYLQDHESTRQRAPVHGLEHRMFWWDHREPELKSDDDLKSHANLHEVDMVASLVEYLLRDGAYSQGDIAVLTPYSGQLAKLHERLSTTCDIWLSDKDRQTLLEDDILALGEESRTTKDEVAISDMLRIATVDDFQGEEAKVIVLSTVRSGGRAGFLKSLNRINVACSRARNGFYIIGNSQTLSQVPMWREVISSFKDRIGESIMTRCHVHPSDYQYFVTEPLHFKGVPECAIICDQTLDCGHNCPEKCHPSQLHGRLTCHEPCTKVFPCGHSCPKLCYQKCDNCQLSLDDVTLNCGHRGQLLCSGETSKCEVPMMKRELPCGHDVDVLCGEDPEAKAVCQRPCDVNLPCGHQCTGTCGQCHKKKHQVCFKVCNRAKRCGHHCKDTCHFGRVCAPCLEPCEARCGHGVRCPNRCQEICDPCVKPGVTACDHETPSDTLICCLPSLSLPCSMPCDKQLDCGHHCPSLHGEQCPPSTLCPRCKDSMLNSPLMMYSPKCGHLVEAYKLDDLNNITNVYEVNNGGCIVAIKSDVRRRDIKAPKCFCGMTLSDLRRYSFPSKLMNIKINFDLLLAKMGRQLNRFASAIEVLEPQLGLTSEPFVTETIRPDTLAAQANSTALLSRTRDILSLQKDVIDCRDNDVEPFERSVRRLHESLPQMVPNHSLLFRLRFEVLEYRVISVRMADDLRVASKLVELPDPSFGVQRQGLKMLEFVRKESLACAERCQSTLTCTPRNKRLVESSPSIEIEIRLQQLQFKLYARAAKDRRGDDRNPEVVDVFESQKQMKDQLAVVIKICESAPGAHDQFLQTTREFRDAIDSPTHRITIPKIQNQEARQIEKQWGQHVPGYLAICGHGHIFSKKTCPQGCGECGMKPFQLNDEVYRESSKYLFEDKFLSAMRKMSI